MRFNKIFGEKLKKCIQSKTNFQNMTRDIGKDYSKTAQALPELMYFDLGFDLLPFRVQYFDFFEVN